MPVLINLAIHDHHQELDLTSWLTDIFNHTSTAQATRLIDGKSFSSPKAR